MKGVINGASLFVLLTAALGTAAPGFAQAPESTLNEAAGSVIVFPKFLKGLVAVDGTIRARTEIEVQARCPEGTACSDDEPVKIRFHWVCPGSEDIAPQYVCTETGFDVTLSPNGKVLLNPEDAALPGDHLASPAPCPRGYLIGWAISPTSRRPIKYDALTGNAVLRESSGGIASYEAIIIRADPNLATRAEIATEIDPRTGTQTLVFDGGAGHYQRVAEAVPSDLVYDKLTGPLSSSEAFLILLTLDVRLNRPNYPTVIDLDFRADQGVRASTSWDFRCWKEIRNPNIDANFTLAGARTRSAVVISGEATKVPYRSISDIPGPVTLLGLVPSDEGRGHRTMDPAYIVKRFDTGRPTTVLVLSK
jgi:hypothetical protein